MDDMEKFGELTKEERVKPSINWDHVDDEFIALAEDNNGAGYLYREIPNLSETHSHWRTSSDFVNASIFKSYVSGGCNWKDELVLRPGYKQEGL